jgi:DNA adenine methylase
MSASALAKPEVSARPFVKMVGGKTQLLPAILPLIQSQLEPGSTYHEPFLGGGAVFFALRSAGFAGKCVLSDSNMNLVGTYNLIADEDYVELLIAELRVHEKLNSEKYFYEKREQFNTYFLTPLARAALFIYLNKTCFNGLHRVNGKTGHFNVPWGRYKDPTICDAENLRACSLALGKKVHMDSYDYTFVLERCMARDVVYLDPPYVPVSKTSNFVGYGKGGFTSLDQAKLEHELTKIDRLGAKFVLSNADCEETRTLYRKWNVQSVSARRNVNSKGKKRGPVGELVVTNF